MLALIFFILLIVGLLTVQQIYKRYSSNPLYKLPGPPTIPFFGNALLLNDSCEGMWNTYRKCLKEYYPTVCFWLFSTPMVFMRHPDDIQILSKSKTNVYKADIFYSIVKKYGSDGFIVSGGKKWQERRKLMSPAFLRNNLRSFAETTNKYAELLIQQMLRWEDESIQNALPLTMKIALDIFCDNAMGYDLHTIGAPYAAEYKEAFEGVMELIIYRATRPHLKDWMLKYSSLERKAIGHFKIMKDFSRRVIEERRKYHKANGINLLSDDFQSDFKNNSDSEDKEVKYRNDFNLLDILCACNAKGLIDEDGMIEELETLVAAGFETSGLAIAFTLLLLAENETEQNLAREEVIDVMKKCGNKPTLSDVQNLQYLDRCVKETLRLFPSAPMIGRKLVEDTQFSNCVIPRNTDVFACFYDAQRDPNFWPEPNKFKPDRFLPEFSQNQHPYAYLPFSGGVRNCIGQKHAIVEIKLVVAHILNNFYLESVDFTCNISFGVNVLLKPTNKDNLRVKFIKIKQNN